VQGVIVNMWDLITIVPFAIQRAVSIVSAPIRWVKGII